MIAVRPESEMNTLSAMRYRSEFGQKHIYSIQTTNDAEKDIKHTAATRYRGEPLFKQGVTFAKLASLISQNATIKSTTLTQSFDYKSYCITNEGNVIPLFTIDPKGKISFFTRDKELEPKADWIIVSLSLPQGAQKKEAS
jgi:hypothetical protein